MNGRSQDSRQPDTATGLARAEQSLQSVLGLVPARWLWVDVQRQRLALVLDGAIHRRWTVSTAAVGINARQGSGGTPPGVHRIAQRIGLGMAAGTEFSSRKPTGRVYPLADLPRQAAGDLILSRIITLEGCEEGVNRGPGVDSRDRFIYLHGTNREDQLGTPASAGCIRLSNRDIIAICDIIREGDALVVT